MGGSEVNLKYAGYLKEGKDIPQIKLENKEKQKN